MSETKRWPAWLVGLVAGLGTLVGVLVIGAVAVIVSPGNEEARGEKVGEGAARLALFVGVGTGVVVHFRRKKKPETS